MPDLVAVYGETGSGKSDLAERWASQRDAHLINFDAFQMVRGFDIGTNKPKEPSRYELIDTLDPTEQYGVGRFIRDVLPILARAYQKGQDVVMVGGTGLYARALLDEWSDLRGAPDPDLRAELEANSLEQNVAELRQLQPEATVDWMNPVRVRRALERLRSQDEPISFSLPAFRVVKIAPEWDVADLDRRLAQRLEGMLERGWVEEVEHLLTQFDASCPAFRAIGYSPIAQYLNQELSIDECRETIVLQTRQYAKRQRTWLRSEQGLVRIQAESLSTAPWPGEI